MDNRYYDNVISEMQSFLDEQGFKADGDGFKNKTKKIAVKYNEDKQVYELHVASGEEDGNFGEMTVVNSWLFDDTQTAKDAESVGMDFVNSLKKELGVKNVRSLTSNIELPTATKSGNITVTGFTKKMLDLFPTLKDEYKAHVAVYSNFLYLNFFGEKLVPLIKEMLESGNKKRIKKLYNILDDAYLKGDKDTINIVVAVLVASAYGSEKADDEIKGMLAENTHFLQAYQSLSIVLPRNKKLFKALVKQ